MDENASQALMMAFALFVFVIALTLSMYLIGRITETAEVLTFHTDETNYYDNVAVVGTEGIERYVSTETVIPTLYRYYKENFCVKIYDATGVIVRNSSESNPVLVHVMDVNLEGRVESASKKGRYNNTTGRFELLNDGTPEYYEASSLTSLYNTPTPNSYSDPYTYNNLYMFGVPWLGSTDNMKLRIDLLINGESGYINNQFVDYRNHPVSRMVEESTITNAAASTRYQFKENFVSYSYSGETMTTEDGDVLVTGASSKDKIVITYTFVKLDDESNDKVTQSRN